MSEKIQGIVLKSNDRKEKDVNILLFSLEKGKVWATLRGVKSPKAKMKIAQNMFSYGNFIVEEGKSGFVVTNYESIENFHELAEDIDKYFEAAAVLELVEKIDFSSAQERAQAFVLTLKTLKNICFSSVKRLYCLDKFLIELFKITGSGLYTDRCSACGNKDFDNLYINYAIGELVCVACKNETAEVLPRTVYMALKILNATDFEKLSTVKLAKDSEIELVKILCKNFEALFGVKVKMMGIL